MYCVWSTKKIHKICTGSLSHATLKFRFTNVVYRFMHLEIQV